MSRLILSKAVTLLSKTLVTFSSAKRQIDLIEAYYKFKINDNIEISPDIQFVMNPGGLKNESPATIFGLRCRVKF